MKRAVRTIRILDNSALASVTGGIDIVGWLGLGEVPIVPGTNQDRTTSTGRPAEREAAETRH